MNATYARPVAVVVAVLLGLGLSSVGAASARTPSHSALPCPKPKDPIAIGTITLSANPVQVGQSVTGVVTATCNVAAVTAQVGTYRVGVPKVSPGLFRTTVNVPLTVFPGEYTVTVTAIRTDGATVSRNILVEVRW